MNIQILNISNTSGLANKRLGPPLQTAKTNKYSVSRILDISKSFLISLWVWDIERQQ